MSSSVKYSQNFQAIESRIRRLPVLVDKGAESLIKKRANRLVKLFHDGIKGKTLRLRRLTPATIAHKATLNYPQPGTPLYGLGDENERRTYANMMEVHRKKSGSRIEYHVTPSKRKHHASKLRLSDLFTVHEYGTTINNAFGRGISVRIPPRPALRYAYHKLMGEVRKQDPGKKMSDAIVKLIRNGDESALQKIAQRSL